MLAQSTPETKYHLLFHNQFILLHSDDFGLGVHLHLSCCLCGIFDDPKHPLVRPFAYSDSLANQPVSPKDRGGAIGPFGPFPFFIFIAELVFASAAVARPPLAATVVTLTHLATKTPEFSG